VDRVPPFPHLREDNVRQGFVEGEQLVDVLGAIEDTALRDFVEWLSVAGMRVGEARQLEWKHLHRTDQGDVELRVPAELTKNRQARVLPIAGPLKAIIYRRRAARRLDCVLIFHRGGKPIRDFRAAWSTACKRAGRPGLLVHDLRRSAIRALRQAGVSEEITMRISGHQTASVFRRYRIVTTDEVAGALEQLPGSRVMSSS
jgi:integrase